MSKKKRRQKAVDDAREQVDKRVREALGKRPKAPTPQPKSPPSNFKVDGVVDLEEVPHLGPFHLVDTHSVTRCKGRVCVIHNPTDHHMRDFPLIWNKVEVQMERLCPHDHTHPDPDDIFYWTQIADEPWKELHDCCPHECCKETPK